MYDVEREPWGLECEKALLCYHLQRLSAGVAITLGDEANAVKPVRRHDRRIHGAQDHDRSIEAVEFVSHLDAGQVVSLAIWRNGQRRNLEVRLAERQDGNDLRAPRSFEAPETPEAPEAMEAPQPPEPPRVRVRSGRDPQVHVWKNGREVDPKDFDDDKDMFKELPGLPYGNLQDVMGSASGRGRLGVRIETLSDDLATALGAPDAKGVLVVEVMKDTPAERAGLKSGDVITHVAGRSVSDTDDLVTALRDRDAGRVSLSVVRRGSKRTLDAELGAAPSAMRWNPSGGRNDSFFGNPEPGKGRQGYRVKVRDGGGSDNSEDADLQQELRDLRRQVRELREQLQELRK